MSNKTRMWAVTEQELQDEMVYLKQQPGYQQPIHLQPEMYDKALRNIAYWQITRFKIIALGILCVVLFAGVGMFANAMNKVVWMNYPLLKTLLIIGGIYAGLYLLAGIPLRTNKTKLSIK